MNSLGPAWGVKALRRLAAGHVALDSQGAAHPGIMTRALGTGMRWYPMNADVTQVLLVQ
jgi:hypothetical protein